MNKRQRKKQGYLHPLVTKNQAKYVCLHCNHLFKAWSVVSFNQQHVCPICGISKNLGQYDKIENE